METSKEAVIQNLKDAGCCGKTVEKFLELGNQGDTGGQLRLLSQHRRHLLEKIHQEERCIHCLDYLVYEIERQL
ncbi:MAG: hypothetical protein ACOYJZ_10205 [Acutalibacter sp.]|jgi:hypothetical protein